MSNVIATAINPLIPRMIRVSPLKKVTSVQLAAMDDMLTLDALSIARAQTKCCVVWGLYPSSSIRPQWSSCNSAVERPCARTICKSKYRPQGPRQREWRKLELCNNSTMGMSSRIQMTPKSECESRGLEILLNVSEKSQIKRTCYLEKKKRKVK